MIRRRQPLRRFSEKRGPRWLQRRRPLRRWGKVAQAWEEFKQHTLFPRWWALALGVEAAGTGVGRYSTYGTKLHDPSFLRLWCVYPDCTRSGTLHYDTVLERWLLKYLQVDHRLGRDRRPDLRYSIANCQPMCAYHNSLKG